MVTLSRRRCKSTLHSETGKRRACCTDMTVQTKWTQWSLKLDLYFHALWSVESEQLMMLAVTRRRPLIAGDHDASNNCSANENWWATCQRVVSSVRMLTSSVRGMQSLSQSVSNRSSALTPNYTSTAAINSHVRTNCSTKPSPLQPVAHLIAITRTGSRSIEVLW